MKKVDWKIVGVIALVLGLVGLTVAMCSLGNQKDAAQTQTDLGKVTTATSKTQGEEVAAVAEKEDQANEREVQIVVRTQETVRTIQATGPVGLPLYEYINRLCQSGVYADDPACGSGGRKP